MMHTVKTRGEKITVGDRLFMHGEWVEVRAIRPMEGDPDYDRIAEIRGDDMRGRPDLLIADDAEFIRFYPLERT